MMDLSLSPSLLALGGVAAILATGWQHVKVAFSHISSLLILKASFDSCIANSVSLLLRRDWTLLPSSSIEYHGLWLKLRGQTTTCLVPFKLPPYKSSIFVKGRQVVVFNTEGSLTTLRGLCDVDKLVCEAVSSRNEEVKRNSTTSRFQVINVVGEEKGAWAGGRTGVKLKDVESEAAAPGSTREPNPEVDKILLYSKEDLNVDNRADPFANLPYDDTVMSMVNDIKHWYSLGDWYTERNIPWRRGVLLSGPPGTGKSTLTQATAELLGIPLYLFHLSTLSNQEFIRQWQSMRTPCCAVFEDFDTSFDGREPLTEHKALTFDCILNQISGVQNKGGILLFVTTNRPDKIDSAMGNFSNIDTGDTGIEVSTRPGRLDVAVHIGPLSEKNRRILATKTLRDWPDLIEKSLSIPGEFTPPQFEEICIQLAMRRIREQPNLLPTLIN